MAALSESVELLVKMLVKNPDDVIVTASGEQESDDDDLSQLDISLQVHPDDRGRVIGRRGRTINAIRTLVKAAAIKSQQRVNIEVLDN